MSSSQQQQPANSSNTNNTVYQNQLTDYENDESLYTTKENHLYQFSFLLFCRNPPRYPQQHMSGHPSDNSDPSYVATLDPYIFDLHS